MGSFTIGVPKMSILGFERITKKILDFYIVFWQIKVMVHNSMLLHLEY
jgi:hypothetical protein